MRNGYSQSRFAFTLPELLVAVAIFAVVATTVSGMYITAFRESRRAAEHNRIYEDARFIMRRIADEVGAGMIDYDEYFNQMVILRPGGGAANPPSSSSPLSVALTYGNNYGRYYSSFYNPGSDEALGFDCNTVPGGQGGTRYDTATAGQPPAPPNRNSERNGRECVPLRQTIDRNTGANPFAGKFAAGAFIGVGGAAPESAQNAFCGTLDYRTGAGNFGGNRGLCAGVGAAPTAADQRRLDELYLISADGTTKTILARECVALNGAADCTSPQTQHYALSLLRMVGEDMLVPDGVPDVFKCAPEFSCVDRDASGPGLPCAANPPLNSIAVGAATVSPVPESPAIELAHNGDSCDGQGQFKNFTAGFVPVSSLRVSVTDLKFIIKPSENPFYAFSEEDERNQPRVTVSLTVAPAPGSLLQNEGIAPITLVQTISSQASAPTSAPVIVTP